MDEIKDPDPADGAGATPSNKSKFGRGAQASGQEGGGKPTAPYGLKGPQVEFQAAYWLLEAQLRMPALRNIKGQLKKQWKRPLEYSTNKTELNQEIEALKELAATRNTVRKPDELSKFINLQNPPFGAIFNGTVDRKQFRVSDMLQQHTRIDQPPNLVLTGAELARMFENESPGLIHHNALHWFLFQRSDVSPPRQARISAALNLTIYAALAAAWHYKWAEDKSISYRQRPVEYAPDLNVLYDKAVAKNGSGDGEDRPCPDNPGTPRHPAYPSGHSTYSAAATHILKHFFEEDSEGCAELDKLANNIGIARLWAGVHWKTDHEFGQALGISVAETIIGQLEKDCVPRMPMPGEPEFMTCKQQASNPPPDDAKLAQAKQERTNKQCVPGHDNIPPRYVVDINLRTRVV